MQDKKNIIDIIKIGLSLFIITAIAALALALINNITSPIIYSNNLDKQNKAMQNVLASATEFVKLAPESDIDESVSEAYLAKNSTGDVVGICISITTLGYAGDIDMVVGVDKERKVTGVDIVNQSETAGLGANAKNPEFINQYVGKGLIAKVVKSGAENNQIDAITSATITSKAVTNGVNNAINAADILLSKEGL